MPDVAARPLRILSLCSGIAGLDLGVHAAYGPGARTVGYVEGEAFCVALLTARMQEGYLDTAPIFSDVKSLKGLPWRGAVDCIVGGYPCQPFSLSGQRKGKEDPRHLWPYIADLIQTIRPAFCFFENVPGHLTLGFEQVCEDLSRMGYAIEAGIFSAEECGAPHRRERLFCLAYANTQGQLQSSGHQQPQGRGRVGDGSEERMANADSNGCNQGRPKSALQRRGHGTDCGCVGTVEPAMDEPAYGPALMVDHIARGWPADWEDGVPRTTQAQPHRTDQLRALGNAVVPIVAAKAWTTLSAQMEIKMAARRQ